MECERALSPGRGKIDAVGNARTACTLGRGAAPPAAQPAGRAQKARRGMGEAAGRPAERPGPREPPPVCREHCSQFPKSSHCVWKGSVLQSTPGTEAQGRRSRNSLGRCEKVHTSSAWGLVSERPQHATGQPSPLPFLPHNAGPRGACFRVSRAAGAPAISWTLHRAGRGSEEKARGPQPACSGGSGRPESYTQGCHGTQLPQAEVSPPEDAHGGPRRCVHACVHSRALHSSRKVGVTRVSIHRQMERQKGLPHPMAHDSATRGRRVGHCYKEMSLGDSQSGEGSGRKEERAGRPARV